METIEHAVHLCVDMQRIFRKGGIWERRGWSASCR
jgi:hypothetical protein